jgi:hypothetical protein
MDQMSLILTIVIILLILVLFGAVSLANKKVDLSKKESIKKKLLELEIPIQSLEASSRRDAIIKLDNLLTKSLQYYFNNSESCGFNLKKSNRLFKKKELDDIWYAHKVRNDIVHNDYEVKSDEALKLYNIYKFSIRKILK